MVLVLTVPEEVLAKLSRRAQTSGATVEQEAAILLSDAVGVMPQVATNEPITVTIKRQIAEIGLSDDDWHALDASLAIIRAARADDMHRWIDFDDADFGA